MEDRPSKLQISVSSIREVNLTDGEIKVAKKQSELKRKSSNGSPLKVKKSHDAVQTSRDQLDTAAEHDLKRTASLSVSQKVSAGNSPAIKKSSSTESAENKKSHSKAKKRSSSAEQQARTQSQEMIRNSRSTQGVNEKTVGMKNASPKPSVENAISKVEQAIARKSSSAEQRKQAAPKELNSNPNIGDKHDGDVATNRDTSRKSKSAGPATKTQHAQNTSNRKSGNSSSAPAGKQRSKDVTGPTSPISNGMAASSPSSHAVKPSKTKQATGPRPSHGSVQADTGATRDSSKHSEHTDHPRRPSATSHPSNLGHQHQEAILSLETVPFSDTPFPFQEMQRRADSVGNADPGWMGDMETPTPWGGLGGEAAVALVTTPSGAAPTAPRPSDSISAAKQRAPGKEQRGSVKVHQKRSADRQKSVGGGEEQCLSLSMARAVTDEHKRSFFTTLDDDVLEKLRERAAELKPDTPKVSSSMDDAASRVQLQETSVSATKAKPTTSGKRVSSGTSIAAESKTFKRRMNGSLKGKSSGENVSEKGSKDTQSTLITLENPFKKNKDNQDDGEVKNAYASALLDKWMADGAKDNAKATASKITKETDPKSKKLGLLKQLLAAKKPTRVKEKVLQTLTERHINLLIPQSQPEPGVIRPSDQVPAVGVSPIDVVQDSEAGHSQGPDSRQIQEEFFTSPESYRSSIAQVRQRMAHRPGSPSGWLTDREARLRSHTAATSTEPAEERVVEGPPKMMQEEDRDADEETATLADAILEEQAARAEWMTSSSSEVTIVDSEGKASGRRKSAMRRKRTSSVGKYQQWKRKASNKAYMEYRRKTSPGFFIDDDEMSQSTSLSLYPASSSEAVPVEEKTSWSDISSVQGSLQPGAQVLGGRANSTTRATLTEGRGRTEGTQTSSTEYLLLDRRSCLVKVLAALQRLNTDEALQVARILRRSLDEDRVYEDISVKQILEPKKSEREVVKMPVARVESEKVMPKGSESRSAVLPDTVPDQDYDDLTRIVSQLDLMVRSKLRITAAPYSLIYDTLINYHLEITQEYSPSVAVFNYYLTEQGHPLFSDTSGFFRPTILQVARESLYPRLYAHRPLGEPRELPAGDRLLDLQLLMDELLICPFCGQDVVWGQDAMCVDFCCDSFAEVIASEYEDDLGRIRRQASLRRRRTELGDLEEDPGLLEAALEAAASEQQPPAKLRCQVERRTRLKALQRYGQDGTAAGGPPQLLPFDLDIVKKAAAQKTGEEKGGGRKSHKGRHKSTEPAGEGAAERKASRRHQRHSSETRTKSRGHRGSAVDGGAAGDETHRGGRGKRKRSTKRELMQEVEKLEAKMARRLTAEEVEAIMQGESVMRSDARGLSITAGGIEEKLDVTSLENIPDRESARRGRKGSQDFIIDDAIGIKLSSYMHDADDEAADTESTTPSRRRGKGRGSSRRPRKKTRSARDREAEGSVIGLGGRDGSRTKRPDRSERDSAEPDDQLHYRLSESAFLEEGLTQLPWDGPDGDTGGASELPPQLVTQPADSGPRQFLQERYPDGKLFVTWFDDGSGHVMYPSGEPAILITVEPAGRRFVVLPDQPFADLASSQGVLAMFDPKGIGFVYSVKGEPRLLLDQREGWYHREDGTIRRWHWADLDDHVHHSPTLQPVIFALSRHVAIRVIRQDYLVLSFWAYQRSARFNVGVTAKPAPPSPSPGEESPTPVEFRLRCQPSERQELAELRDRVRRILGDMARITDEPVKYLTQHQRLLQRGLSLTLRRPWPRWLAAEPRQPQLPGGASAALGRRSAAAVAAGSSARRAFLLQRMAIGAPSSADRGAASAAGQLPPAPPPPPSRPPSRTPSRPASPPPSQTPLLTQTALTTEVM